MVDKTLYAVITGDIVDSSKAGKEQHALLFDTLKKAFSRIKSTITAKDKPVSFDIYRGDSFQGFVPDPRAALQASLTIRASLRKAQPRNSSFSWDARTAIGLGTIDYLPEKASEGDGEAYRRSGPYLDDMKTEQRLSIVSPWGEVNEEMQTEAALLDAVMAKWSPQQAEIVLELMEGKSRKTIGKAFGISQAAVHYRVKGAGWFAVKSFIDRYNAIVDARMNA